MGTDAVDGGARRVSTGESTALTLNEVATVLGLHYMTVYRYVRTGRLEATKDKGEWRVEQASLDAFRAPPTTSSLPQQSGRTGRRRALEARLIDADEPGAWAIIEGALISEQTAPEVHHSLIIPAMQSIGRRWASGEITVRQEHQATSVAFRVVARLGPLMRSRGRNRGTVVLGAPSGDMHSLGVAILADLLRSVRFNVVDLGAHVPAESFKQAIENSDRVVAVALSASLQDNDDEIRSAIAAIRDAAESLPVVLGGPAVRDESHAKEVGADFFDNRSVGLIEIFDSFAASPD